MSKEGKLSICLVTEMAAEERLSNFIKELRGDISQRSFAKMIGVSYASVRAWEECESMPSISSLEKIAEYSNQSIEQLLAFLKDEKASTLGAEKINYRFADQIIPQIEQMPRKEKSKLAKFLIEELT